MTLPPITWTIDGYPVLFEDGWSANAGVGSGFDRLQATILQSSWDTLRGLSGQGSIVKGWQDAATPLWEGRLSTIPDFSAGKASIAAQGYHVKAEKKVERLFVQSRDMSIWQAANGEPHLNGSGVPVYPHYRKFEVNTGNRLRFRVPSEALVLNGNASCVFYAEGMDLEQIEFTMSYATSGETTNLEIQLQRANGPTGAEVNVNTWATSAGNNGTTKTQSIATDADLLLLGLNVASAHTPGSIDSYILSRIIVWGNITTASTYNAYQIVDYISDQLGFDTTDIVTATYNVLPFDWDGDWAGALDYLAEIEDRHWGVYDDAGLGPRMVYDDFGSTNWTCYMAHGAEEDLSPIEVFNRARVWYETPSGVRRSKHVDASPDPLAAVGITNTYELELEDRQADATVATNVATKLAARFSRQRYEGRLTVFHAWDDSGRDHPYAIRPGDTVTIADWAPGEAITLRVMEVEYRHDRVELGVEKPITLAHVLRKRRRKRKKDRRKD